MKSYKIFEDGIEYTVKEYPDKYEFWYIEGKFNNQLHRVKGPAVEWNNGHKAWYLKGKRHRIDGPAIEQIDGVKFWYLNGIQYTKKEYYKELIKRKLITKKEAFIELL